MARSGIPGRLGTCLHLARSREAPCEWEGPTRPSSSCTSRTDDRPHGRSGPGRPPEHSAPAECCHRQSGSSCTRRFNRSIRPQTERTGTTWHGVSSAMVSHWYSGIATYTGLNSGFSTVSYSLPSGAHADATSQPLSAASAADTPACYPTGIPFQAGSGRCSSSPPRRHRGCLHCPGGSVVRLPRLSLHLFPVLGERAAQYKFSRTDVRSRGIILHAHRLTKYLTPILVAGRRFSRVSCDSWLVFVLRALLCPLSFSWLLCGVRPSSS